MSQKCASFVEGLEILIKKLPTMVCIIIIAVACPKIKTLNIQLNMISLLL